VTNNVNEPKQGDAPTDSPKKNGLGVVKTSYQTSKKDSGEELVTAIVKQTENPYQAELD
jgi:hypothetical protein